MKKLEKQTGELERVVQLPQFRRCLAKTARLALSSAAEAGMTVYRGPGEIAAETVRAFVDNEAAQKESDRLDAIAELGDYSEVSEAMSVVLRQGALNLAVVPSLDEMYLALPDAESEGQHGPIAGIGTIEHSGRGALLCLRYCSCDRDGTIASGVLEEVIARCSTASYLWPRERYAETIAETGVVSAAVLRFAVKRSSNYAAVENPRCLREF